VRRQRSTVELLLDPLSEDPAQQFQLSRDHLAHSSGCSAMTSISRQDRPLPVQVVHQVDGGRHAVTSSVLEVVQALHDQRIYSVVSHQSLKLLHIEFYQPLPINLFLTKDIEGSLNTR
jgi:hypothetical protein